MASTEYEPGDVVLVKWIDRGRWERALVSEVHSDGNLAVFIAGRDRPLAWSPRDVRPLVVLDLDDPQLGGYPDTRRINLLEHLRDGTAISQHLADQIEAQTKPPRIPEPGLWGVVADEHGYYWTCSVPGRWVRLNDGRDLPWLDIEGPTLIREGVES